MSLQSAGRDVPGAQRIFAHPRQLKLSSLLDEFLAQYSTIRYNLTEYEMSREEQMEELSLLEQLKTYSDSDYYPLHMPGHKRRFAGMGDPYAIDITEIDGFDNLHHAEGILRAAQRRAARLYGAEETHYLINGSTCGILAAVSAAARRGDTVLMARNCHKAVYHALLLNGLHAQYLYPNVDLERGINGSISPEEVRQALWHQQKERQKETDASDRTRDGLERTVHRDAGASGRICAVILTSPTYDGVVSDVRQIAQEAHRAGAVLIVDEAHGAHFPMHGYFPGTALLCGADIVIHSLHKTMPALTQTALLHVQGSRVDRDRLRRYLGIYQTSSPSYVLMAGMDRCIEVMEQQGEELFGAFVQRLERMRRKLCRMDALHLVTGEEPELCAFGYDRSKVVISTENCALNGLELAQILRRVYHLEPEMAAPEYVTAIMTVCDTQEGFDRLTQALLQIDEGLTGRKRAGSPADKKPAGFYKNEEVMTIEEARDRVSQTVGLPESAGSISAEFVYLYPPGIPLLVPGERITQGLVEQLTAYRDMGFSLQGLADHAGERICVVCEADT